MERMWRWVQEAIMNLTDTRMLSVVPPRKKRPVELRFEQLETRFMPAAFSFASHVQCE